MKKLVYSNQPINPYLGDTFEPHCDVELAPIPNKYSILFQKDGNITGNWTADGSLMIWSTPSKVPDLMVTSGSSLYPTFTARQVASSTSVDGVYSCSLQYSEYNFIYQVSAGGFRVNFLKEGTSTALGKKLDKICLQKLISKSFNSSDASSNEVQRQPDCFSRHTASRSPKHTYMLRCNS